MTTKYPRECARCGQEKPPWFEYCRNCYAIVQSEQLKPNTCDEQDCDEVIDDEHYLCRAHWQQLREGKISECPECGEYKPTNYSICRSCNKQLDNQPALQSRTSRSQGSTPRPQVSNIRRPYDDHDGEDDAKAKDKRYWFNRQDNGICNYCGNRYPYDQLQMEHMIPKQLGGPDHRRNMQLSCGTCNKKKGTFTDLEFRQLNSHIIPTEERKTAQESHRPQETGGRDAGSALPGNNRTDETVRRDSPTAPQAQRPRPQGNRRRK